MLIGDGSVFTICEVVFLKVDGIVVGLSATPAFNLNAPKEERGWSPEAPCIKIRRTVISCVKIMPVWYYTSTRGANLHYDAFGKSQMLWAMQLKLNTVFWSVLVPSSKTHFSQANEDLT